ncbi:MAG: hypothetical protein J6T51_04340 [Kiritimatiellae bacterium]|nr:hypothetical protein [Kiritimatiellia bacterium]
MEIRKKGFIIAAACAIAAPLFAAPHPVPPPAPRPVPPPQVAPHHEMRHGRMLPVNAVWCEKCDGDGYYWTWYGWKKTCGVCDGRGWCMRPVPPPLPPMRVVPPPMHTPAPAPAPRAKTPAPRAKTPAPRANTPPKAGPQGSAPAQHGAGHKGGPRR